jgi:hypothetical protein
MPGHSAARRRATAAGQLPPEEEIGAPVLAARHVQQKVGRVGGHDGARTCYATQNCHR